MMLHKSLGYIFISANHLQSPRTLFVDNNSRDTLSNHRPSFNASVMTNTLDRASRLLSPFYSGNTTFGGANAVELYKRNQTKSLLLNTTDVCICYIFFFLYF